MVKLSLAAALYHIWLERKGVKSANILIEAIAAGVRARVSSWKDYPRSAANKDLCLCWGFSLKVLGSIHVR